MAIREVPAVPNMAGGILNSLNEPLEHLELKPHSGANSVYCGAGCQSGFGVCGKAGDGISGGADNGGVSTGKLIASKNGRCGGSTGYTCKGSHYGDCCSQYGFVPFIYCVLAYYS